MGERERALALVAPHPLLASRSSLLVAPEPDQPVLSTCSVELVGLAGLDLPVDIQIKSRASPRPFRLSPSPRRRLGRINSRVVDATQFQPQ